MGTGNTTVDITFIVPCRPFAGVFDTLQRRAIASWRSAIPNCHIVLLGEDIPDDVDRDERWLPATNARGITTLTGVWEIACEQTSKWVCVGESDILFDATLPRVLSMLAQAQRPFVIGQRWDLSPSGERRLHPPSAISYCLFRSGQVNAIGIPPFAIGRTLHDNWLVWAALTRWHMQVIDATACLTATHLDHPYAEYGDKEGMFRSAERAENQRLARVDGMPRPYGVDDANWVLTEAGELLERERIVA